MHTLPVETHDGLDASRARPALLGTVGGWTGAPQPLMRRDALHTRYTVSPLCSENASQSSPWLAHSKGERSTFQTRFRRVAAHVTAHCSLITKTSFNTTSLLLLQSRPHINLQAKQKLNHFTRLPCLTRPSLSTSAMASQITPSKQVSGPVCLLRYLALPACSANPVRD